MSQSLRQGLVCQSWTLTVTRCIHTPLCSCGLSGLMRHWHLRHMNLCSTRCSFKTRPTKTITVTLVRTYGWPRQVVCAEMVEGWAWKKSTQLICVFTLEPTWSHVIWTGTPTHLKKEVVGFSSGVKGVVDTPWARIVRPGLARENREHGGMTWPRAIHVRFLNADCVDSQLRCELLQLHPQNHEKVGCYLL